MKKLKSLLAKVFTIFVLFLLFLSPASRLQAQNTPVTVSGKITDDNGVGLQGATIQVKGTSTSTVSTADGSFQITAPGPRSVLIVSYVGLASQEVAISNRQVVNVSLSPDAKALDEVVMIGYGTTKKSDVTGALTKISAETIRERPAQNVLQAIQGKAAGVHVSTNFKPGELPVVKNPWLIAPSILVMIHYM